jgi:hypothetical protein
MRTREELPAEIGKYELVLCPINKFTDALEFGED